ncbi:DMT family transporter [Psychromonas sp. 14N.309.X.WAT.B.A12]|uniref:DMT family transporter n=1 Tax=Psychromonas sp. 14N.309.X.WAT.B.A12 TaxID=2998322 RepID=UPI0025B165CA|nr:DMT family transporter [Psychromonas sp. 14N.309.X.WAT.B.A12]MDN2662372.1 DMT family transporter [Psychromonas sp. 14N.309.X.WAT.B.A12]
MNTLNSTVSNAVDKRSGFIFTKYLPKFPLTEMLLLLVAIFWGTSYGLTKEALIFTSVLLFIAIRFSLTSLCMAPIVFKEYRAGKNKDWKVAIPSGLILSAIFLCEVYGISQTSASNAAFLISLSVILTAFFEPLINRSNISPSLIWLALCSIVGVYCLTHSGSTTITLNTGDYFILCAATLRAAMVTVTKRLSEGKDITTSMLTAIQSFIVAISALVLCFLTQPFADINLPATMSFWLTMTYLVLCCTLFAFCIQNYAIRKISPTKVSLLMGSEPLFGALFAVVWLNESFTVLQMIGGGLILASVLVTSMRANK